MRRVVLGRDVEVIRERPDGLELRGAVRLAPGRSVTLISVAAGGRAATERSAMVWTWRLAAMGSERPIFRGMCRWLPIDEREELRPVEFLAANDDRGRARLASPLNESAPGGST